MLLHWMHTRYRTLLTTAPGCTGLGMGAGAAFSGLLVSVDMGGF